MKLAVFRQAYGCYLQDFRLLLSRLAWAPLKPCSLEEGGSYKHRALVNVRLAVEVKRLTALNGHAAIGVPNGNRSNGFFKGGDRLRRRPDRCCGTPSVPHPEQVRSNISRTGFASNPIGFRFSVVPAMTLE
jgi:hypothetical protein